MWAPSHEGISGDEKAYTMFNEAITFQFSTKINRITTIQETNNIKNKIMKIW